MAHQKKTKQHAYLGTHYIVELFGCSNLNNIALIRQALKTAAERANATVLHTKFHKFSPQGLTGYLLLAESHISIHTWPEYGYAALDVFTCGKNMQPEKALACLKELLGARKVTARKFARGKISP